MTKAIIDFSGYTGPNLAPAAQTIHDSMTTNAATFGSPPVDMSDYQKVIDRFDTTLNKKSSGAYADTLAFNIARHELEGALGDLGNYVNIVANGDPAKVIQSGFPSYDTAHPADPNPPAAPTNLVLRQGDLSGSLVARYHPTRPRSINEVQTNIGDPNNAAEWKPAGLFTGGKATISGLTPGSTVWVRVRTVGLRGIMGAWSDPAKIMVV